ncbi:MAG: prenyltransferase/squalene oxidase repeat-containing protein [Pirellulales bacterium]
MAVNVLAPWLLALVAVTPPATPAPTALVADTAPVRDATMRTAAIQRAVQLAERAARNYPSHRTCFACHHQTFPLLAQSAARRRGLSIDTPTWDASLRFTRDWFQGRKEVLSRGGRVDGRAITVAYGLWTLALTEQPADELSDALVANLLQTQHAAGYWEPEALRPPAEESKVFVTALALRGLAVYGQRAGLAPVQTAREQALRWLASAPLVSLDDHAGRLLAAHWTSPPHDPPTPDSPHAVPRWRQALRDRQRPDGGWAQLPDMESDAYATGLALWSLAEAGEATSAETYARGVDYLLTTQKPDGSWHVVSRCDPVQTFFDNGDPHGEDQFLSLMATCWSAAALAR